MIRGDATDFYRLANDLSGITRRTAPALVGVMDEAGKSLRDEWRSNAAATAGSHGKHYPNSITHEILPGLGGIGVEAGPDTSRLQGAMGRGFEFGSRNQPPHLDGTKALADMEPRVEKMMDAAIGALFG